jgi:hypothetical protein
MIKEQDKQGNVLLILNKEGNNDIINLYIKLTNERHKRHIGTIVEKTRRLHVERSEDIHLLIKANAYGFNHYIISNGTKFDTVVIHEKKSRNIYQVPRQFILDYGKFMFFKQQGFELQTFIGRDSIKQYKVTDIDLVCRLQSEYRINI